MKTIARIFRFSPGEIDKLFLDEQDHLGLYFWYNDAIAYIKEMNDASKPKK